MLEYIFFHRLLAQEFAEHLRQLAIPFEERDDDMGFIIAIPDDVESSLLEQADEHYADLMERSENLLAEEDGASGKHVTAITIELNDGRNVQAPIRPELMNKLLDAISFEELNELVDAIAKAVENPDERPICQR